MRISAKSKNRYHNCDGKEKAGKYYLENEDILKENAKIKYRNLSEGEKEAKRKYGKNRGRNMKK